MVTETTFVRWGLADKANPLLKNVGHGAEGEQVLRQVYRNWKSMQESEEQS